MPMTIEVTGVNEIYPIVQCAWIVAILSFSSFTGPPQVDDIRIQPSPSFDTIGPFFPSAIFLIIVMMVDLIYDNKVEGLSGPQVSSKAQFSCPRSSNQITFINLRIDPGNLILYICLEQTRIMKQLLTINLFLVFIISSCNQTPQPSAMNHRDSANTVAVACPPGSILDTAAITRITGRKGVGKNGEFKITGRRRMILTL